MDIDCLKYTLTPNERQHLHEQGYLVVTEAVDRAMNARLIAAVNRVDARERTVAHGADRLLSFANILPEDDAFVDLTDWPTVFPKVWGLLGWNIYVYHTHLDVSPPLPVPPARPVAWHQDSMRVNEEIESHPRPRLSLKIGYYLTDVSGPDWGNTLILPGSHLTDELDCPNDGDTNPAGAVPLRVPAGAALILDRRLWHSRSPNFGPHTRKVIWIGYAYRWLRPKDEMTVQYLCERVDPIRRQLLGLGSSANSGYDPSDEDVPLRQWLQEHRPDDARWSPHHDREQARPPLYGARGKNTGRR
ncbi:MAG: phytanoyl-CoA dioxygenase family protein [Planctomycetes bacterium]|nr:phytanoyl-CoA dioxygenase family protein [Planctomycetota bacterium]